MSIRWRPPAIALWMLFAAVLPARSEHSVCGDFNANGELSSSDALLALKRAVGQEVRIYCPFPSLVPRTGQTACFDEAGASVGCSGTGQDGELLNGATRSFTDNGDGTITDDATGLMWEKLSDDNGVHDVDNEYLWVQAFSLKVAQLNAGAFAGHTDWRLPNRFELGTLVNAAAVDPAVFAVFHSGCAPSCTVQTCNCTRPTTVYWTSTTFDRNPVNAWTVKFSLGYPDTNHKAAATAKVRAVRGGS